MDKENTNQNITPVFWDENDGKWHFTEKCLNPEFQITYVTNPHTFETPDEAMQAYLGSSQDICCTIFCFRTLVKSEKNR